MNRQHVPGWYIGVAVVALIWNVMGVLAFMAQLSMSAETLAQLSEAERQYYAATPLWATLAFGAAVFGGFLGSLGLLLRRRWALPLFQLSLIGLVLQNLDGWWRGGWELFGPGALALPIATLIIAVLLIGISQLAIRQGWMTAA